MFAELVVYKQAQGDCKVPTEGNDYPELGKWCATQRSSYKNNKLSPGRITRLKQLGLVLDPYTAAWEENFAALGAYKQAHGDCNVPERWKDNPKLGRWCSTQRKEYKTRKHSPDRITRLEQLGFVWDPLTAAWEEMFSTLAAYKQTHGDCNVPAQWKGHPRLGKWCAMQRRIYNNNKLSPDRVKRLEAIGFVWKASPQRSHPLRARRTR